MHKWGSIENKTQFTIGLFLIFISLSISIIPSTLQSASAVGCINWAGLQDDDCDGLANAWETAINPATGLKGFYDPNNDHRGIALKDANPLHKDLYVEIDSMSGRAPSDAAINDVIAAYIGANVWNPLGGGAGVKLHVEATTSPLIPLVGCTAIWSGFDALKAANIGTQVDRASNTNQLLEESNVKVYGLFINSQCGNTGSSGISENPGNDFVVSLGSFNPVGGNSMQQESAFMHELGHTLGLDHGGSAPTPDCKPNFLSVMSTDLEFTDDVPGRNLDYSRNTGSLTPPLISMDPLLAGTTGLDESRGVGIGLPTPPSPITVVGKQNQPTPNRDLIKPPTDHSPVNFNRLDGSAETGQHIAVHNVGRPGCDNSNSNMPVDLYGYWDWIGATFWSWSYRNANYQLLASESTSGDSSDRSNSSQSGASVGQLQQSGGAENDNQSIACNPLEKSCELSPCDPQDKACTFVKETNLTETANESYDYGNRTNSHQDQSFEDIKTALVANLLSINNKIQSLPQIAFNSSANATDVKQNFNTQIATGEDNLALLVSNSSFQPAISSLVEIETSLPQLIIEPYLTPLVVDIKYLIAGLQNMLPDN